MLSRNLTHPRYVATAMLVGAISLSPCAVAQDASFGCKVLLCAAASAPSWSGIPYCVPVMQSLFRQLARGKPWPNCPEGNASGLGYDPYLPGPDGLTPVEATSEGGVLSPAPYGGQCADPMKGQTICEGSGDARSCQTIWRTVTREMRSEPHYVDIATANGRTRFYFSLRGY